MILPDFCGIMQRLPTSRLKKNMALMLRFITLFQASSGWSSAGAPQVAPALFTRMSMVPYFASTASTMAGIWSNLERSFVTVSTSMPLAFRCVSASFSSSALRAVIATLAPISPSASAICSPRPREPPVMRATLPLRSNRFFTLISAPFSKLQINQPHPARRRCTS